MSFDEMNEVIKRKLIFDITLNEKSSFKLFIKYFFRLVDYTYKFYKSHR